jgi:hypothetical protein
LALISAFFFVIGDIFRYGGTLTLMVVYGYHVQRNDDEFLQLAQECVELLSNKIASTGSVWMVDIIPARTCLDVLNEMVSFFAMEKLMAACSQAPSPLVPWCVIQAQRGDLEGEDGGVC